MRIPTFFLGFLFVFWGVFSTTFLTSCATVKGNSEPFYTRIFEGNYDDVWLATLKALNDYPLKLSNKDAGKIQTEVINGPYNDLVFQYPDALELPERFRYALKVNFAKLASDTQKPLVRVRIIKDLERFQDFYAGWIPNNSDGLEEKVLLYRVEHVLNMERHLAKQKF